MQTHPSPMAKVHPRAISSTSPSSSSSSSFMMSSERETFTVWMKSLVFNGYGCTVYDANGCVAYRVDNYDCKRSDEVYVMDLGGKTLIKILRKKLRVLGGQWRAYKWDEDEEDGSGVEEKQPWFTARKACRMLRDGDGRRRTITVGCQMDGVRVSYKMEGLEHKSAAAAAAAAAHEIRDMNGIVVAEMKMKETTSGIALGEDVLSLVVEPNVDRLLIMGLVIVWGLINHKM